ncbi:MAG: substrate-binding domain-containing protein, partial [Oscillospiraceae bacterium]|nr:substrate-binding domain-containing protein [Oscillospiraceae bacterium]
MKKKIAVFSTGWSGEIFSQFLQGMIGALSGEETDIMLFLCYATYVDTTAVKKGEMDIFDLPDMNDFDGAVLFGSGLDFKDTADNIIARCREADVPTIIQGTRRDGVSYVSSDNYQAVRDMCAHLIDHHGVKTITYFAGSGDSFDSNLRLEAIRDHLRDIGREDDLTEVFYTNWENAAATRRVNEICASGGPLPDAFICANDGLAMETCITLDNNGYDVPGDVLVCGFDHLNVSRIFSPSIASVDQCFVEMGAAAIKLWKELRAGAAAGTSEVVPCRFV